MKLMEVTCRCGYVARGSERVVIQTIQVHARAEHALDLTPADVRAVWRAVEIDLSEGRPGRESK